MSRLTPDRGYLDGLFGPFPLLGLGAGLTIAPLTAVVMHNAPRAYLGAASSLNQATTALTVVTVCPLLALLLFAVSARRIATP